MAGFDKPKAPAFSAEVFQNEFLPEGAGEVNAVVTVTATGVGSTNGPAGGAVVIMVDCSGSMDYPATKMRNARNATAAALNTLHDGMEFAVVAGAHWTKEIFPGNGRLAVADTTTRKAAKYALRKLTAGGGTAIGGWLKLADKLLSTAKSPIRHGILLTDGRNEHESPEELRAALDACAGHFTCDCRGVGTDWEVDELTSIASALLGNADIVADPGSLADDFRRMMEAARAKEVADVQLRVWTPAGSTIRFVKQVAPSVEDLTGRRADIDARAGDYPTGSWGDESRDYHVCVEVPPGEVGQERLAAKVSLVLPSGAPDGGDLVLGQGLVRAVWTGDRSATTRVSPQVAHYTDQAELARAVREGLRARREGDAGTATARLGRAVQLAHRSGNADTAKLLAKVVDVVDESAGTVRLKGAVADADEMALHTRSTRTVRVRK